ncbi:hypothetical protein LCL95_17875 [Bacillus timonensis]|nr:hypothetical protein [Bacillus timonensis]
MRIYINLLLHFSILLVVVGCSSKTVAPDNPENTAWLMKLAIDNNDYASFDSLFADGRKGSISEMEFKELKDITTAGAGYRSYELLTFENGEMLLVKLRLTPPHENNKIEIEDVIIVPDDMKELFND